MNFQFVPGEGGDWDLSMIGPFFTIMLFAIPVLIFLRARTRIFYIMFGAALFWIITPVFFQAITVLLVGLAIAGFILVFVALKKGYISKKMAGLLTGVTTAFGGGIFYWIMSTPDNGDGLISSESLLPDDIGFLPEFIEGPGLFMLAMIALFAFSFFLYQRYELFGLLDFGKEEEEEKEIESDVSSAVDKAIRDLLEGKDIKPTIMECYGQMSNILEERGIRDEKHMTPREFEKSANDKLDVTTTKISRIREIFELAKYSTHRLEEEDKERVIEDLEALRDELE